MALLAFMCLGVAVKGFSQFDISKTTLKGLADECAFFH